MATETTTATTESNENYRWMGGVAAGALAAIAMGAMMAVQMPAVLEVAIPSMYFLTGGAAGFTVHVAHGAVLGVGFAAVASQAEVTTGRSLGLGLAYGAVVWAVLAAVVMPIWLSAVGSPANPPLPNVNVTSLVAHLVYGAVLGLAYPTLRDALR